MVAGMYESKPATIYVALFSDGSAEVRVNNTSPTRGNIWPHPRPWEEACTWAFHRLRDFSNHLKQIVDINIPE
jgi:hypothetical protein